MTYSKLRRQKGLCWEWLASMPMLICSRGSLWSEPHVLSSAALPFKPSPPFRAQLKCHAFHRTSPGHWC